MPESGAFGRAFVIRSQFPLELASLVVLPSGGRQTADHWTQEPLVNIDLGRFGGKCSGLPVFVAYNLRLDAAAVGSRAGVRKLPEQESRPGRDWRFG